MNRKNQKGFIFISVLALMILITSVAMSTAVLNMTYSGEVSENTNGNKLYYISYAGLEMVYGALNHIESGKSVMDGITNDIGPGTGYTIEESKFKLADKNLEIKSGTKVLGYAKVSGNLEKAELKDAEGNTTYEYYYRIVSKGSFAKDETDSKKISTLTMFVFTKSPNAPKIYSGDKKTPNY